MVQAHRANALIDANRDDTEFGYRYLADEARAAGQPMASWTAWRLCSDKRRWSVFGKARHGTAKRPGPPVHDDRVPRAFTAGGPIRLWLTDITEHPTAEGTLCLWAAKDAPPRVKRWRCVDPPATATPQELRQRRRPSQLSRQPRSLSGPYRRPRRDGRWPPPSTRPRTSAASADCRASLAPAAWSSWRWTCSRSAHQGVEVLREGYGGLTNPATLEGERNAGRLCRLRGPRLT